MSIGKYFNCIFSIADYIKDNKIKNPIVIGHSMGGGIALALASEYPDLVDKIIVVDALPCFNFSSNNQTNFSIQCYSAKTKSGVDRNK